MSNSSPLRGTRRSISGPGLVSACGPDHSGGALWLTSGEGARDRLGEFPGNFGRCPEARLVRVNWKDAVTNAVSSPSDSDLLGLCALGADAAVSLLRDEILGVEQTKSGDLRPAQCRRQP